MTAIEAPPEAIATTDETQAMAPVDAIAADQVRTAMIEIPVLQTPRGYSGARELKRLSARDAQTLRGIAAALHTDGHMLESGRKVIDSDDAIVWLFQQIRAASA